METVVTVSEQEMSEAVFRYVGEKLKRTGDVKGVVRFHASKTMLGKGRFCATVTIPSED